MRLIDVELVSKRLQQLVDEISQADKLDYYDRLRAFKRFCDDEPVLAHCLVQLPRASFHFKQLAYIEKIWPAGEESYAKRWAAISEVVDAEPSAGLPKIKNSGLGDLLEESLPRFTRLFVVPFCNYLVHQLESSSTMLSILLRYKRWAEWFEAGWLRDIYSARGEAGLDQDLRRFLFESGIDYPFSQPDSPGGRVDIIAGLETDDPLVLEVKIWDSDKGYKENRCRDGLRQAMDYATKYGKDKGYVVVFNLDTKPLVFVSPNNTDEWPPRIEHGNRTYYFIDVDVAEQSKPVSKRDKGKLVEINKVQLADLIAPTS
jgi:hypothetical protein